MNRYFKNRLHVFLFPVIFIYFEIVLRIFNKTGLFSHLFYPIAFGISAGFLCSCIASAFPRKINHRITSVLLFFVGLLYIIECLIKSSFQFYMPFNSIATGAGGVMGGFTAELTNAILHGIPVIFFFFLPGILYLIYGKKKIPAYRRRFPFLRTVFLYSLIAFAIGSLTASIGNSRETYKTQFDFDTATQNFGLLTTIRLNHQYDLFGNKKKDSFDIETPDKNAVAETSKTKKPEKEKVRPKT